jgi:hypothetical protein
MEENESLRRKKTVFMRIEDCTVVQRVMITGQRGRFFFFLIVVRRFAKKGKIISLAGN